MLCLVQPAEDTELKIYFLSSHAVYGGRQKTDAAGKQDTCCNEAERVWEHIEGVLIRACECAGVGTGLLR